MTYLLYVFIYFCLTNELLSSPNDIFAELWENNLPTKDTLTNDQKVEPYEKQSIGVGKKASGFRVLRIKEEPHEEPTDYGRECYGTVQVKHEAGDGTVQVKQETDDGAVQVKQEAGDGTVQVKQETDDGTVQVNQETDYETVQEKHEPHLGKVQVQEEYLTSDGYSSNGSPGGSDYEKSKEFEEKSDSLSNEEQQKSEKKIIKKVISDYEKKNILKKFLAKKERLAKEFGSTPKSKLEEIARELGTSLRTIRYWRFKFGIGIKKSKYHSTRLSDDQRKKILKEFDKMKEKHIKKNKFKTCTEIEEEIAHKLNVNIRTIYEWKKKFGKRKFYYRTESERLQLIKKYFKMIKHNPHLYRNDIAAKLNIPKRTINRWISELKNKISVNNTDSDSTDEDVLPFGHPQTSNDGNVWAWNRCTKRRTATNAQR